MTVQQGDPGADREVETLEIDGRPRSGRRPARRMQKIVAAVLLTPVLVAGIGFGLVRADWAAEPTFTVAQSQQLAADVGVESSVNYQPFTSEEPVTDGGVTQPARCRPIWVGLTGAVDGWQWFRSTYSPSSTRYQVTRFSSPAAATASFGRFAQALRDCRGSQVQAAAVTGVSLTVDPVDDHRFRDWRTRTLRWRTTVATADQTQVRDTKMTVYGNVVLEVSGENLDPASTPPVDGAPPDYVDAALDRLSAAAHATR